MKNEGVRGLQLATLDSIRPKAASFAGVSDERYLVRMATGWTEIETALRLRNQVFNIEINGGKTVSRESDLEVDAYDFKSRHLIVVSRATGETVGTYRLNSIETVGSAAGFYSSNEFTIEDLPQSVLQNGIEIGRACIAAEHRNTKVLFLLWKALLAYLEHKNKRYFFGCCSIFTQDENVGRDAYRQLERAGHLDDKLSVVPCSNAIGFAGDETSQRSVELPALFNMYLRIGAKICGPPMIDRSFGTIDFFVVFDTEKMSDKYQRLFS